MENERKSNVRGLTVEIGSEFNSSGFDEAIKSVKELRAEIEKCEESASRLSEKLKESSGGKSTAADFVERMAKIKYEDLDGTLLGWLLHDYTLRCGIAIRRFAETFGNAIGEGIGKSISGGKRWKP